MPLSKDELYRIRVYQLIVRLQDNPEVRDQVRADPRKFLAEHGFPAETIDELLEGSYGEAEEAAAACTDTTCWSSACPGTCTLGTCWVTLDCSNPPKLPPFPDPFPPVVP
jgi:hypothetical protein